MLKTALTVVMLWLLTSSNVWAGKSCEPIQPEPAVLRMALTSALALQHQLNQLQPQLALVARVGQDLSKYHLRYSHIGFVVKDGDSGAWRVKHLLNQCGSAHAELWEEGLANFFMDQPHRYQYLLIQLSPTLQTRLFTRLSQSQHYRALFSPNYNMLAYPFSDHYQNSNQWVLELVASAAAEPTVVKNRQQAQLWLQLMKYQPTTLQLSTSTRLGARLFRANVNFDDHPSELRFSGKINTVTVESIREFIQIIDPESSVFESEVGVGQ